MTDNEIIGRLYAMLEDYTAGYGTETVENAINLINRQKAEIERYKQALRNAEQYCHSLVKEMAGDGE